MLALSTMYKKPKILSGYSQVALSVKRPMNDLLIVYRLLRSAVAFGEASAYAMDKPSYTYSISVVMISGTNIREEEYIYDVARDGIESKKIFRLLSENTVTPCTVYEILDDYMACVQG